LRSSVLGPGKVGRSLAAWIEAAGGVGVRLVGREGAAALSTAGEDLLIVAVPDQEVAAAAALLAARPQARVALHTAGALDASALAPLARAGTAAGSFHPLKAFPAVLPEVAEARGVCFALDGDPEAVALARRLVAAWGGAAVEVPAAARPVYHLAATLAAGGVVTLLAAAIELASALGLPSPVAGGYFALARGALERAEKAEGRAVGGTAEGAAEGNTGGTPRGETTGKEGEEGEGAEGRTGGAKGASGLGTAAAITGPAARGDLDTVERGLAALAAVDPAKVPLVAALARETLHQRGRVAPLTAAQRALLARLAAPRG
jgi:predicted short-subunit dehydrogenase-like oxidoreductase (DUF2520 family)